MEKYILKINILLFMFISGLFLVYHQYNNYILVLFLGVAIFILNFILEKNKYLIISLILLYFLGLGRGFYEQNNKHLSFNENEFVSISGEIIEEPKINEKNDGSISVKYVVEFSNKNNIKEKVLAYVKYKNAQEYAEISDLVQFSGQFTLPHSYNNPGAFDYSVKLQNEGINGNVFIKDAEFKITKKVRTGFKYIIAKEKAKVLEKIENVMPKDDASALFDMVFGGYDGLKPELLKVFSLTGIVHLLSVSGSHIALIIAFVMWLGNLINLNIKLKSVIAMLVIILYATFSGFVPPVIRASFMGIVSLIGIVLEKEAYAKNSLSLIAFIMLMISPNLLYDISFQLSFMATFGLLYLAPVIRDKLKFIPSWLGENLAITLSAQLSTLPFLAWYFNSISLTSFISNLIAVPIMEFVIILTLLAVLIGLAVPLFQNLLLVVSSIVLGFVYHLMVLLSKIPYGNLYLPSIGLAKGITYYIVLFILFHKKYTEKIYGFFFKRETYIIYLTIILIIGSLFYNNIPDKRLEVHFIDVGQGDCCLVITPHRKAVLIDTGGSINNDFNIGEKVVVPYLRHIGITELEYIILTHCHVDHAGGAGAVVDNIPTKYVLIGKENRNLYAKVMDRSLERCRNLIPIVDEEQIVLDGVTFDVFSCGIIPKNNENEYSNVVKVNYGKNNFLITGDLEVEGENAILNKKVNIASEVLKVGHHGSKTSSSVAFLNEVRPEYGIISVGYNNHFGHPGQEVLDRMKNLGIKIFRTDINGAIICKANKDNIKVEGYR